MHCLFQITKVQVDSFDKGKRIPACHLQVDCRKRVPTDLKHVVKLIGAESPGNAFIISVSGKQNMTLCWPYPMVRHLSNLYGSRPNWDPSMRGIHIIFKKYERNSSISVSGNVSFCALLSLSVASWTLSNWDRAGSDVEQAIVGF